MAKRDRRNIVLAMCKVEAISISMHTAKRDKEEIRNLMRAERRRLPQEQVTRLSASACSLILATDAWQAASRVGLYMAVRGETDAGPLLADAWSNNKQVFLPLCSVEVKGSMRLVSCGSPEQLVPGAFGIPEPDASLNMPENASELNHETAPQLLIIPGLAFDLYGSRLGMGGGYYDRLLASPWLAGCLRIGFCYEFQVIAQLPREDWDLPMHALCTEKELRWLTA